MRRKLVIVMISCILLAACNKSAADKPTEDSIEFGMLDGSDETVSDTSVTITNLLGIPIDRVTVEDLSQKPLNILYDILGINPEDVDISGLTYNDKVYTKLSEIGISLSEIMFNDFKKDGVPLLEYIGGNNSSDPIITDTDTSKIMFKLNGSEYVMDKSITIERNGRVLFPYNSDIFSKLGFSTKYDPINYCIEFSKNKKRISTYLYELAWYVNGTSTYTADARSDQIGETIYIPIEALCEASGMKFTWETDEHLSAIING